MPKHSDVKALVRWRDKMSGGELSDTELRDSLSVEGVEYDVPAEHLRGLIAFRHYRQDARLSAVRVTRK